MSLHAYITNTTSGTVSVIDTTTNTVVATITVGSNPDGVAVTPDGTKVYLTNFASGTVSVINTATNTVLATITVGSDPSGIAVTPDGTKAYVANTLSNSVSVINTDTNTVSTTITTGIGSGPLGIAITPDGTKAYVTNEGANTVSVIDLATNTVIGSAISVGTDPGAIAISPNSAAAYVGNVNSGTVSVIDTTTNTVSATITVGTDPNGISVTPDGTKVYVANQTSNNVSVIATATNTVSTTISLGAATGPVGVSITPDGITAYVANSGAGTVVPITVSTNTVGTAIAVGTGPAAFGQFIQPPTQTPIAAGTTAVIPPQGRLTLSSTAPVMTADATAQSTIYYLPYQGASVPVYNGAAFGSYLLNSTGISLVLDSTTTDTGYQASGSLYDIFAFVNGGILSLGTGPAWTNNTTRSAAISQVSGIWVNSAAITLRFGNATANTVTVLANQATYLGTMYATANGQTGMQFQPAAASGGTNNMLALYNAYNRVLISSRSIDSTSSWSYSTNTIRAANNSTSNRINWVDGLQQSFVQAEYQVLADSASGSNDGFVSVGLDSTSTAQSSVSGGELGIFTTIRAASDIFPQLGFHYVQALEVGQGGGATFFGGASSSMHMKAVLEM